MADELDYDAIIALVEKANKEDAEQSKRLDWLNILTTVLSLTAFGLLVAVWIILDKANPHILGSDWKWLSFFGENPVTSTGRWSARPVNTAYILLIVSVVLCVTAFICDKIHIKRKGGKYRVSVFLVGAIALINFVSFLVQFLPMGILGRW